MLNREARAALARDTLRVLEEGGYLLADGQSVSVAQDLKRCLDATQLLLPEDLAVLHARQATRVAQPSAPSLIEVRNEGTLAGIRRLLADNREPVAVLNFASARNPGGGFLGGSQAQEESLARSSGLYASLLRAPAFYERHRSHPSLLYSDALILSPHCPVFRDDEGVLLREASCVTFISGAAPNAGELSRHQSPEVELVPQVFRRRITNVLALAAREGCRRLVLGAWGCGVFRNDPRLVAQTFTELLRGAGWERHFSTVLFAVLDRSPEGGIVEAFRSALASL